MIHLKQYGEMRTGTNAISFLLGHNAKDVHVICHGPGSKHSIPDYEALASWPEQPLQYLISVRDPYSWMYSMLKNSQRDPSFGEHILGGRYDTGSLFENARLHDKLIRRWNYKYFQWLELIDDPDFPCHVVKLENIFRDQEEVVRSLAGALGVKVGRFCPLEREIAPGGGLRGVFNRRKFYLQDKFFREMNLQLVKRISNGIEWKWMSSRFGYERINV